MPLEVPGHWKKERLINILLDKRLNYNILAIAVVIILEKFVGICEEMFNLHYYKTNPLPSFLVFFLPLYINVVRDVLDSQAQSP